MTKPVSNKNPAVAPSALSAGLGTLTIEERIASLEKTVGRLDRRLANAVTTMEIIGLLIPEETFLQARDVLYQLEAAEQQAKEYRKNGCFQNCLSGQDEVMRGHVRFAVKPQSVQPIPSQ